MSLPHRRRWPALMIVTVLAMLIFGGVGFVVATALEERDAFCTSCHTVPETTYYNRARRALADPKDTVPDLATAHYRPSHRRKEPAFACIACHRGDSSVDHRIATLARGARDAFIYLAGRADPTIEKTNIADVWLPDAACVGCHGDTLLTLAGLENHFHTHLPQAARALASGGEPTVRARDEKRRDALLQAGLQTVDIAITCASCHQAHKTFSDGAANAFIDVSTRNRVCVACHQASRRGPQDVDDLD